MNDSNNLPVTGSSASVPTPGANPPATSSLIQDPEGQGHDPIEEEFDEPGKMAQLDGPGVDEVPGFQGSQEAAEFAASQVAGRNEPDVSPDAPDPLDPANWTDAQKIAFAEGAEVVSDMSDIPAEAAALLMAKWMRKRGFRAFAVPQQVKDATGTQWQVLGRNHGGFALYGQSDTVKLQQWDDERRRIEEEIGTISKAVRAIESYRKEVLGKIEFAKAQASEQHRQMGGKGFAKDPESIKVLKRELKEANERDAPTLEAHADLVKRMEKHLTQKPRDVRYLYEFDKQLSQLLVTSRA